MTSSQVIRPSQIIRQSMTPIDWVMLLTLSVLWGGSFFFVGVAVMELPTLSIVVLRVSLAALVLWMVILLMGHPLPRSRTVWVSFWIMGLLNNIIPFALIVWGQKTISSGLASVLNATTPLFTVLAAGLWLRDEPLAPHKFAGVASGFAGVTVMIGFDALSGSAFDVWAQIAILGAALSYACAGVFGRRFKRLGVSPLVTAAGQVTASSVLLTPLALVMDRPWALPLPSASTWAAIMGLAILSTAFAYVLYFQILERAGATNLLLVTFLIPVSATLLGVLVLKEQFAWTHVVGMALIGFGLIAIDGRLLRQKQ